MIDTKLNKFLKPTLNEIAKLLIKFGFKANYVTFSGFFFGLCCFYFIVNSLFLLAIIFLFLNRLFDGLDGAIARLNGETDIGAFSYINAKRGVTIEDEVQIGSHCSI